MPDRLFDARRPAPAVQRVTAALPCLIALILFATAAPGVADSFIWTGAGGDSLWGTAANWAPHGVPDAGDTATVNSGTAIVLAASAVDVLAVGGTGTVEIIDATLTVGAIDNDGEIRLTSLLGGNAGGVLEFEGETSYTGIGKISASSSGRNQLVPKDSGASLWVSSPWPLRLEGLSGAGQLDVSVKLKIENAAKVVYANLTGTMATLDNAGLVSVETSSELTVNGNVDAQGAVGAGMEVKNGSKLVLASAVVKQQSFITDGTLEIQGGTLEGCANLGSGAGLVTASTTILGSWLGDLELANAITLNISGDVSIPFRSKISSETTATIQKINDGTITVGESLSLEPTGTLHVSSPLTLSPGGALKVLSGDVTLGANVSGSDTEGDESELYVAAGALLNVLSTIERTPIRLDGSLWLVGTLDSNAISGSGGTILGGGGRLRDAFMSIQAIVRHPGTGVLPVQLRLSGSIQGEPRFLLDSDSGRAELLADGDVQLQADIEIKFTGPENRVKGFLGNDGFTVPFPYILEFKPENPSAQIEASNFIVPAFAKIVGDQLELVRPEITGVVSTVPGGELTVRGSTNHEGAAICHNGGLVKIAGKHTGPKFVDDCGIGADALGTNQDSVSGGFVVDPDSGWARLVDATNLATIEVLDGGDLDLSDLNSAEGDFFINEGVVRVQGDQLDTMLRISAWNPEFHVLGDGEIVFTDSEHNKAPTTPTKWFTLYNYNTIRGAVQFGQIVDNGGRVSPINRGRIEADGANPLVIDTGPNYHVDVSFQNEHEVEVSGSGGLEILDNQFANMGDVEIQSGSEIRADTVGYFQEFGSTTLAGVMDADVVLLGGTYDGGSEPTTADLRVIGQMRYELERDTAVPLQFQLGQDGAMIVDVAGYQPGVTHDHLSVGTHTNLGGWVVMRNELPFIPRVGDEFEFLEWTFSRGGEFDGVINGTSVPGLEWELVYDGESFGGTVTARVAGAGTGVSPDLRLQLFALDDPVFPGGTATFRAMVTNVGTGTSHAVQLDLQIPPALTVNNVTGATCDESFNHLSCALGELGPGGQAVLDITFDIPPEAPPPVLVSGEVSGLEPEVGFAPNTAEAWSFLCTGVTDDAVISNTTISTVVSDEACVSFQVGPGVVIESGGALHLRSPFIAFGDGTTVLEDGVLSAGNQ